MMDRPKIFAGPDRREVLVSLLGAAGLPWLAAFDAAAAPLSYRLVPGELADGVWMIAGAQEAMNAGNGGAIANVVVLDSSEGAIVIDTGPSLRFGNALVKLARDLTDKEVARVYLTHFHPDHVLGNQAFAPGTIAAQQGVIDGLKKVGDDFATAMYQAVGDWMRGTEIALPTEIVVGGFEDIGNRRLRFIGLAGHTESDLAIFDETSGLLFSGDLVFLDRAPTTPHADISRWIVALATLGGIPHSLLVPGHGPAEPGSRGIEQTRRWLEDVPHLIRDAVDKGRSMTEIAALPLPAWTAPIALARYEFERTISHLVPKLEADLLPRVDGDR